MKSKFYFIKRYNLKLVYSKFLVRKNYNLNLFMILEYNSEYN